MSRKTRFMVVDDELIVRESLAAWLETRRGDSGSGRIRGTGSGSDAAECL